DSDHVESGSTSWSRQTDKHPQGQSYHLPDNHCPIHQSLYRYNSIDDQSPHRLFSFHRQITCHRRTPHRHHVVQSSDNLTIPAPWHVPCPMVELDLVLDRVEQETVESQHFLSGSDQG